MFLDAPDSSIIEIFIESPNTANQNSRGLPFRGIFTDGDLVEFQVAGQFFGCHDVGHRQNLQGKRSSYDCFRSVNDEYFSYIRFKIIKINPKYMKQTKSFPLRTPIQGRAPRDELFIRLEKG